VKEDKMATATAGRRLSNQQLVEVLSLIKGADSVELKLTVPEPDQRATASALGLDPLDAQIRQVYFFDTPRLALNKSGLVVRARRVQGKGDDSVIKLRPVVPNELPAALRKSPDFVVEVDAMPGGYVCSASLKYALPSPDIRDTVIRNRPIRKLFSKEQRKFFAEKAPEGITLDELAVLGPIVVFKLRFAPKGFGRKVVAELWNYPDNAPILELSTKAAPSQAMQVAAEVRAFLSERGVSLSGKQQTKTKTALEFFVAQLKAAGNGA
jgi:hypothetical protein